MIEKIRTFVGIKLDESVIAEIQPILKELKALDIDARWVPPENLHISLKFLGDITLQQVEEIKGYLEEVAKRHRVFEVSYKGLGVFPNQKMVRVLWVGGVEETGSLKRLAQDVENCCKKIGIPEESREFTAHVTLARVKSQKNMEKLRQKIRDLQDRAFGKQQVKEIIFYKSQLTPHGSIYTPLFTVSLGSAIA